MWNVSLVHRETQKEQKIISQVDSVQNKEDLMLQECLYVIIESLSCVWMSLYITLSEAISC